jgi:hypothetical protein
MEKEMKKMHSLLTDVVIPASDSNFTYGRSGYGIQKITIHHTGGVMSAESIGYLWQTPRECSSHYGIGMDGRIGNYVAEENTAWTDSNWVSNCTSITIETSNSSYGGDWPVSDEALNSLINLCADISKRHGLGLLVPGANLTWHSMYADTTCPGDYLRARMQYIADRANEIIVGKLKYQGHVQDIGWMDWVRNGQLCGTTGQSRRLEALRIDYPEEIQEIAVHVAFDGWKYYDKIDKDTIIGTTGESKAIECIRIKALKEDGSPRFKFRVHIAMYGWTPYTLSDGISTLGTIGQSLRIEAIEIEEI